MSIKTEVISKEVTVHEFPGHMAGEFPVPSTPWTAIIAPGFRGLGLRHESGGVVDFFYEKSTRVPGRAGDTQTLLAHRRNDGALVVISLTGSAREATYPGGSPVHQEGVADLFAFRAGFENSPPDWAAGCHSLLQLRGSWDNAWDCTQELEAAGLL